MTAEQAIGLHANIPRVEAMRRRQELALRPDIKLTQEGMYDLILAETENEERAQQVAARYAYNLLRRGEHID